MARTIRRQRSPWPLVAWPLLAALIVIVALLAGAYLDTRPLVLIPQPTPGTSPTPQETRR